MSLAQFQFRLVAGAGEVDAGQLAIGFEKWADLIEDWRPTFGNVVKLFRAHEGRHFDSEGASTGAPWDSLERRYAAWKSRAYPGKPILVRTGRLRAALVDGRGPGAIEKVGSRSMEIGVDGTAIPYAAAHQTGVPSRGLPARPPVRFNGNPAVRGSFGHAVSQAFQRQIVDARKRSMGLLVTPATDIDLGSLLTGPTS